MYVLCRKEDRKAEEKEELEQQTIVSGMEVSSAFSFSNELPRSRREAEECVGILGKHQSYVSND